MLMDGGITIKKRLYGKYQVYEIDVDYLSARDLFGDDSFITKHMLMNGYTYIKIISIKNKFEIFDKTFQINKTTEGMRIKSQIDLYEDAIKLVKFGE